MEAHRGERDDSWLARVVELFLRPDLAGIAMALAAVAGIVALIATPREEEPQIVVPMADVLVEAPGLPREEVERQVATRAREAPRSDRRRRARLLDVAARPRGRHGALLRRRGPREEPRRDLQQASTRTVDRVRRGVAGWVVKPVEIDDVPIVDRRRCGASSPSGRRRYALRRIAEELEIALQAVPRDERTAVRRRAPAGRARRAAIPRRSRRGGPRRSRSRGRSASRTRGARRGGFDRRRPHLRRRRGRAASASAEQLRSARGQRRRGRPCCCATSRRSSDGPEEATQLWRGSAFGAAAAKPSESSPRARLPGRAPRRREAEGHERGSVARRARRAPRAARARRICPPACTCRVTRDYGETANEKVNELLARLLVAIVIVIGLFACRLGWREGLVVAVAVPHHVRAHAARQLLAATRSTASRSSR